jgi:hypothetical protein
MTGEFTQVVASVIPVIILAAVLEANVYSARAHDAFEREAQALNDLRRDLLAYFRRGESPPIALARQYRDAIRGSAQPVYWGLTALWGLVVLLLSITEVMNLLVLASEEKERWQWLAVLNLVVIGLGFVLLVLLPVFTRLRVSGHALRGWRIGLHLSALRRASDNDASPDAGSPSSS